MTRRLGSLIGLVLGLLAWGCSRPPQPAAVLPLDEQGCVQGHPHMLWQVSSPQGKAWLLGSIHMADSAFYPLALAIREAFDSSAALAVEIDVTEDSVAAEVGERMASNGLLEDGRNLEGVVGPRLWKRIDSLMSALDAPTETLQPLQPWLAALQIANLTILNTGIDASLGVDVVLIEAAYEQGKEVISLETPAQQVGVFAELPETTQVRYLESTLDEAAMAKGTVDSLKSFWKCGEDKALARLLLEQDMADPRFGDLKERLYDQRNAVMADGVEAFLKSGRTVFVVVGTAHLLGEGSVVDLLRRKGYRVERR